MACRRLCDRLGLILYGSSLNNGCSAYCDKELVEIPHQLRETLLGLYNRIDGLRRLIRDVAIPAAEEELTLLEKFAADADGYHESNEQNVQEAKANLQKLRDAIAE